MRINNVYIVKCEDKYKIGVSNDVDYRVKQLQTGNANKIHKVSEYPLYALAYSIEQKLHKYFYTKRECGEWFTLNDKELALAQKMLEVEVAQLELVDTIEGRHWYTQTLLDIADGSISSEELIAELAYLKFEAER